MLAILTLNCCIFTFWNRTDLRLIYPEYTNRIYALRDDNDNG